MEIKMNTQFKDAIDKASTREENLFEDGSINWDYVDADLTIEGWREKVGMETYIIFLGVSLKHIEKNEGR